MNQSNEPLADSHRWAMCGFNLVTAGVKTETIQDDEQSDQDWELGISFMCKQGDAPVSESDTKPEAHGGPIKRAQLCLEQLWETNWEAAQGLAKVEAGIWHGTMPVSICEAKQWHN